MTCPTCRRTAGPATRWRSWTPSTIRPPGRISSIYRSFYGLPTCTTSNGCFRKVGQSGTSSFPRAERGLGAGDRPRPRRRVGDLPAVPHPPRRGQLRQLVRSAGRHADRGQPRSGPDLGQLERHPSSVPSAFRTLPAVPTVAATGDAGYVGPGEDNYPAAVPGVTAAGGTSLGPAAAPERPRVRRGLVLVRRRLGL